MSTSAPQRRGLADIEDTALGVVPYRQWRQNDVYASDLDQFCELKTEYENLLSGPIIRGPFQSQARTIPPSNKEIRSRRGNLIEVDRHKHEHSAKIRTKGREIHARHASNYGSEISLHLESKVDETGQLMGQLLIALNNLKVCGLARQVPLFGYILGVTHSACIDELVRVYNRDTRRYELNVRGYRSREKHTAPYISNKMLGKVKLMASKELLAGLLLSRPGPNGSASSSTRKDIFAQYFKEIDVDIQETFSPGFRACWNREPKLQSIHDIGQPTNLAALLTGWDVLLSRLGLGDPLSGEGSVADDLELIYLSQPAMPSNISDVMAGPDPTIRLAYAGRVDNRKELVAPPSEVLLRHKFAHDRQRFLEIACSSLEYWLGLREAEGAALKGDVWKCDSCEFQKKCEAYAEYKAPKARQPAHGGDGARSAKFAKH